MKTKKSKGKNITVSLAAYAVIEKASEAADPKRTLREQVNIISKVAINS